MLPSPNQTQRTFLEQVCYLPIQSETFLTARKAEGRAKRTLDYYREKLVVFLAFCEVQAVTQIQNVKAPRVELQLIEGGPVEDISALID